MKKLIIILYGGILLFACSNNHETNQELAKIDTLLYKVYEDSAYNELKKIDASKLKEDDKMYYDLLTTRVKYLRYMPISSDSTINECIAYYEKTGDKEKLAWSYLYKGYLLQDSMQYTDAISYFKKAEKNVPKGCTGELKIRILSSISYINSSSGNLQSAMLYAKMALNLSKASNNRRFIGSLLGRIGVIYNSQNKKDSALIYAEKAILYTNYQPKNEQPYFLNNQALLYWKKGYIEKTEKLLLKSLSIKPTPHAYSLLAELYGKTERKEKVDSLWRLALKEQDLKIKISMMKPYSSWLEKEGRTVEALKVMRMIPQMKDSLARIQKAESMKEIQTNYDRDLEKEDSQNKVIMIIAILLLVVAFALGMITKYLLKITKQKQKALNEIETSQQMIENYEQEVDLLKTSEQKNKRKINELKREITKNSKEYDNMIYHGKMLYESIMNDGNILKWESEDFKSFFSYYRSVNLPFAKKLENDYTNLSKMYKLILCLMEMGFNNNKICKITNQSSNALSTMKSRINKKKIE